MDVGLYTLLKPESDFGQKFLPSESAVASPASENKVVLEASGVYGMIEGTDTYPEFIVSPRTETEDGESKTDSDAGPGTRPTGICSDGAVNGKPESGLPDPVKIVCKCFPIALGTRSSVTDPAGTTFD